MRLTIQEVLGIEAASFDLVPGQVVEVVGPNAAGKTSVATAAQAVLTRSANPLSLPVALTRTAYLRNKNKDGFVSIEGDGTTVTWRPAADEIEAPSVGEWANPLSVPAAAGLVDFTKRADVAERNKRLQEVMLPDPEEVLKQLKEALVSLLPPRDLAGVLETVRTRGWKPAEAVYGDRMRSAKRAWSNVTGKTYGVKVATDWRPGRWRAELDGKTTVELEEEVATARDALAALNRVDAISEAEHQAAEEAKAAIPGLEKTVAEFDKTAQETKRLWTETQTEHGRLTTKVATIRQQLPMHKRRPQVEACPHCGKEIIVGRGELTAFDEAAYQKETDAIEADRVKVLAKANEASEAASKAEEQMDEAHYAHQVAWRQLTEAKSRLDQARAKAARASAEVDSEIRRKELAQAEADVEARKADLVMVKAAEDAAAHHTSVMAYERIQKAIGPRGVRAQMIEARLERFNRGLALLSGIADWPFTEVGQAGEINFGGRPLPLCSESERWRAQALLQLTIAAVTNSAVVVLDRADLLDQDNRQGLIDILAKVHGSKRGLAVLLCSTGELSPNPPWGQVKVEAGKAGKEAA